ncbi:MAG: YceG family protein [Romboutsia sp.]
MGNIDVFEKIFSSQSDRGNYTPSKGYLSYFYSYIGIDHEDSYNLEIFNIKNKMGSKNDIVLFDETIPNPSDFDMINYFKGRLKLYKSSVEDLDIDIIKSSDINYKIKKAFDIFLGDKELEFSNDRVKENFIIKIMSWIKTYINLIDIDKNEAAKIIFYGDIKKHEVYFLIILYLAGFDILYLNPNNKGSYITDKDKEKYNINLKESNISQEEVSFKERVSLGEVVDRTSIRKAMTIGAQASKRISEELLNDAGFIKPWQLQNRKIKSLLLSSTIDEISIYWKQPLKLRSGFTFDNESVVIPVFFSKINGIYNDTKQYLSFVNEIKDSEDVFFISFNEDINVLSKEFTREAFNLSFLINKDGILDKKSILSDVSYSISTLNINQKTTVLEKIEEVIVNDMFIETLSKEDIIKGLYTVLNMNKKFVHMINNFDYALVNPKLVIYMESSFVFSKEASFLMLLLSKIGFDIIILSPSGENCIENVINNSLVDIHRLDKMVYEYRLESSDDTIPILKKIFGKRSGFKWQ